MKGDIDGYLEYLGLRNRSPATIRHYKFVIGRCEEVLEASGMGGGPGCIDVAAVSALMEGLDVGESTMRNYLNIMGRYVEFFTGSNPVKELGLLWNRDHARRKFIGKGELAMMLEAAGPSERMVIVLGAFMGLRRKEMAAITLGDIGEDGITVMGKGHGRRGMVVRQPMSEIVRRELQKYLEWRSGKGSFGGLLMVMESAKGVVPMRGHLTAMSNRISRLGDRLGIEVTCHSLRRLYCTTLAESGCPLETLKELMRHSDINTTIECYIRPSGLRMEEWSDRCSEELSDALRKQHWDGMAVAGCRNQTATAAMNGPEVIKSDYHHTGTLSGSRSHVLSWVVIPFQLT